VDAKLTWPRDGAGIGWAAGGITASLVIGILIEPFRRTIGLENVTIVYLATVVVTAAFGGRAAGLFTAVAAALSYDFFLTTPYHSLGIDSPAQIITVALLLATGLAAGLAGQVRHHLTLAVEEQAQLICLLNTVAQAIADGDNADQIAAERVRQVLDAHRVAIQRTSHTGMLIVADAGDSEIPPAELCDVADRTHRSGPLAVTAPVRSYASASPGFAGSSAASAARDTGLSPSSRRVNPAEWTPIATKALTKTPTPAIQWMCQNPATSPTKAEP
jgi:Domain of unknown function (DUF4118)